MEAIGLGLQAIGKSIGTCAGAFAWVYVIGIACKTFLIFMDKGDVTDFKDWFKFWDKKGRL